MAASPVEITNLRLSHTSNLLGVDDEAPSVSWLYSIPERSAFWQQQTYIFAITSWSHSDVAARSDGRFEVAVAGPRTSQSENVPWPRAFPKLRSGRVYRLFVVAVLSRSDLYEEPTPSDTASRPIKATNCYRNIDIHLSAQSGSSSELARALVQQSRLEDLGNAATTTTTSAWLQFEAGLMGGIKGWRIRSPAIVPIATPWDLQNWSQPKSPAVFRNRYNLVSKPTVARLYITAFGIYRVFINGRPVGTSIMEPGWTEYTLRLLHQTYDITEHLQQGQNVVTVFVADGWYRGRLSSGWEARRGVFGKETGFMALIQTFGPEDESNVFRTGTTLDTNWKCTRVSPITDTGIYDGEVYDSRCDLDRIPDKIWDDVKVMEIAPSLHSGAPALYASTAPPIRCTEILTVKGIITSPTGKKILDFGQNTAGRIKLKGSAPPGTKVSFVHVEVLQPNGTPCTDLLREAKCTDTYIFKGADVEEWEPEFTFHGFRYVQVDPWIEGLDVIVKVYGSDLPRGLAKFHSSHAELNRLVENIRWSARANFLAVCTDCPQRDERLGWTGDINAFSPTAVYIFDCQTFLASWLHGLVDGQKIGGRSCPPLVSPNCLHSPGSHRPTALWQDALITLPWRLYEMYGDKRILSDLYDAMVDYHTNGIPKDYNTGLWRNTYQFGDWLNPSAPAGLPYLPGTNAMYVANAWLCHITNTLAKIAAVLETSDVGTWSTKAKDLTYQWQCKYLNPIKKHQEDQHVPKGPTGVLTEDTQTAYALALNFGLLPDHLIGPAVKRLHFLIEQNAYHLATGFAGTPELLHAICFPRSSSPYSNLESISLAYRVLLEPHDPPSWLYPITMGATSIWERWDAVKPDGSVNTAEMTSLNHYAYGSVGRWIFENVGGIRLQSIDAINPELGWRVVFEPVPNLAFGITSAEMAYDSPKGRVECQWEYSRKDRTMAIEVALPANCTGEVKLLGRTSIQIGAGRWSVVEQLVEEDWKLLESQEEQVRTGKVNGGGLEGRPEDDWVIL